MRSIMKKLSVVRNGRPKCRAPIIFVHWKLEIVKTHNLCSYWCQHKIRSLSSSSPPSPLCCSCYPISFRVWSSNSPWIDIFHFRTQLMSLSSTSYIFILSNQYLSSYIPSFSPQLFSTFYPVSGGNSGSFQYSSNIDRIA